MAIKKSELYSSLWQSCDQLRGGMDASQYKDYVLVMLFIKYVSDKYAGVPYAPISIPDGASFKDMVALKGKPNIGDEINKIIAKIAEANSLTGTIDVADFNDAAKLGSGKDMVDKLTKLIAIFENPELDFSKNRTEGDDLLGDAYEYLMRNFATESGKSKGQFYTPAEVSRTIAKIIGIRPENTTAETTVYDPTCGSGSLLLKVADEADKKISIYGQEIDVATTALARMNMILHDNPTADIRRENTLANPQFLNESERIKTFDYVVANPPFSFKAWSNGFAVTKGSISDQYGRFEGFGVPPAKNGDYAFLLHIVKSLKPWGKGACILPHGVLFRGNAEVEIRRNLIIRGYIKGIIGLPPNLFYGTGIPACIIVLDKEKAEHRKGIFMIAASKGFMKDGNKNRLREQDIRKIVDVFNNQIEIEKFSRIVPLSEIETNDYNLNIPRYINSQEEEDTQDIEAHLKGGIPAFDIDSLQQFWEIYPNLKSSLFSNSLRKDYYQLKIPPDEVKTTIFSHPEFITYTQKVNEVFSLWKKKTIQILKNIQNDTKPKELIRQIGDDLLSHFEGVKLIDKYDVYQLLMTYWAEAMQDDIYALVGYGWEAGREVEIFGKKKEFEGRLISKDLLIHHYFAEEQQIIENLESQKDSLTQQMEEMKEEHGSEEGLLVEVINEKNTITLTAIQKRLKEINDDPDSLEEKHILEEYLSLLKKEAEINKQIKDAQADLDKRVFEKYSNLINEEIKDLIVEEKWMTNLEKEVNAELDRISQRLTKRIKELAERYETPLPDLIEEVEKLSKKVDAHLEKMGYVWK
jgi:type I restriction enzyme M protein